MTRCYNGRPITLLPGYSYISVRNTATSDCSISCNKLGHDDGRGKGAECGLLNYTQKVERDQDN